MHCKAASINDEGPTLGIAVPTIVLAFIAKVGVASRHVIGPRIVHWSSGDGLIAWAWWADGAALGDLAASTVESDL